MSHNISIESGTSVKLKTAGKYCDRDIVVTATGGGGGGDTGWVVCEALATTGETGFQHLQGLRLNLRLPNNARINTSAFKNVESLISLDAPIAYEVYADAFFGCRNLKSVNLPNAKTIYDRAFSNCDSLTSIDLPVATSIGVNAFNNCDSLTSVDLPAAESIGGSAFFDCDSLTSVDLPAATSIGNDAFYRCTNLSTIILRTTETVCVADLSSFAATPLTSGQGHIYVPAVMYEYYRAGYEAALNEVMPGFFDILFRKIEDYTEICG
jgi:hypothetical protein